MRFRIPCTGALREIALEAQRVAASLQRTHMHHDTQPNT